MQDHQFIRSLAGFVRTRGVYIAALACAVAVGVSGVAYFTRTRAPETPQVRTEPSEAKPAVPDGRTVDAAKLLPETPKAEPKAAPEPAAFTIVMPVEGDLIRLYSMDHLSYDPTTRDWTPMRASTSRPAPAPRCAAPPTASWPRWRTMRPWARS